MSALSFHPATPERLAHVAANLRAADRAELDITSPGKPVHDVLLSSGQVSRWAIVAAVDGEPAIAYGVAPTNVPGVGSPWMLATDALLKVRREFTERCRGEVRLMQQSFLVLTNEVHRDNTLSLRWLEWLGFTIDRGNPTGPHGELFVFWKGSARHV